MNALKTFLLRTRTRFFDDAFRSYLYFRNSSFFLGWMAGLAIPACYLFDRMWAPDMAFDTLSTRLLAGAISFTALLFRYATPATDKYFSAYLSVSLAFVFPFTWGLMLFMNAALTTGPASETMLWWVLQYAVSLFIYTQLVNSLYLATLGWVVSLITVYLIVLSTGVVNPDLLDRVFFDFMPCYATAVILGSVANRNSQSAKTESLSAARAVGSNLAHEMRSPLSGISARAQATARLLPILAKAYEAALSQGLPVERLTKRQVEIIQESAEDIIDEAEHANTLIDMLLINTADKPLYGQPSETLSAAELIRHALDRYPFQNSNERKLVQILHESDFEIAGPKVMLVHVLFNLIKNSLYYVQRHRSGDIVFTYQSHPSGGGVISIKDTGPGISPENLTQVFDRFFTTSDIGRGSGIGLHFCKSVMSSLGGSISADSVYGEYTEFVLTFPGLSNPEESSAQAGLVSGSTS